MLWPQGMGPRPQSSGVTGAQRQRVPTRAALRLSLCASLLSVTACSELLPPSAQSLGTVNHGRLREGDRLPDEGESWRTEVVWRARGLRWGTRGMVNLLSGSTRRSAAGLPLVVGDLAHPGGGDARPNHRSHQSGRDVDLVLWLVNRAGTPIPNAAMRALGDDGVALDGSGDRFDALRTWRFVAELATAPEADVQYIFLYEPLIQLVLDAARASDAPLALIEHVRDLMAQPSSAAPHNDHIHLRIHCDVLELERGCSELGPDRRPHKPPSLAPWLAPLAAAALAP